VISTAVYDDCASIWILLCGESVGDILLVMFVAFGIVILSGSTISSFYLNKVCNFIYLLLGF
jgi:threonine/homoserine/homoserine lactone efflux protein